MANILIVEDNEKINLAYKIILEKEGHQITVAFDGKEALEKAKTVKPEIILLDLQMPIMNGLDFLRHYKLTTNHSGVQVLILSNLDGNKEVEEALKLGAYKYILKARTSPRQLAVIVNHLILKNLKKT